MNTTTSLVFADEISAPTQERIRDVLEDLAFQAGRGPVTLECIHGGASNENFRLDTADRSLVLRIAAQDVKRFGIDRERGAEAHLAAQDISITPRMISRVDSGHCLMEFCPGRVLDEQIIREPGVLAMVARTLRELHTRCRVDGAWSAHADIDLYLALAAEEDLALPNDIDEMHEAAEEIKALFDRLDIPAALCHNDVQLPNFILDGDRLWLVDWEYAGMANPYFDLAMVASNANLDDDERSELVTAYWGAPDDRQSARVRLQQFVSALREATWSVIAAPVLDGTGWDYAAWATQYFDRCRRLLSSDAVAIDLTQAK